MTKLTDRGVRSTARTKGQEIVEGLTDLAATLRAGQPLESRFTVRAYKTCRQGSSLSCTNMLPTRSN
jgi:hypothetical protein